MQKCLWSAVLALLSKAVISALAPFGRGILEQPDFVVMLSVRPVLGLTASQLYTRGPVLCVYLSTYKLIRK